MSSGSQLDIVFYDIDDTLYSTTEFARRARRSAIRAMIHHGLAIGEDEGIAELDEVVGEFSSNDREHFSRLLDRLGPRTWAGRNPAILIAAGVVGYHRTKEEGLLLLPDVEAVLRQLAAAGLRQGIISAGLKVKQAEKLIRLGVLEYLDAGAIFFSDQMGVSKPNPKIYGKACESVGIEPARALYVGDRPTHDVIPARQAGLKTCLYTGAHGHHVEECCQPRPDHQVAVLTDLLPALRERYGFDRV